jgi:hypothetical protein
VLGRHRLVVGDACDERAFERLMRGKTAAMAFLDPTPLNKRSRSYHRRKSMRVVATARSRSASPTAL